MQLIIYDVGPLVGTLGIGLYPKKTIARFCRKLMQKLIKRNDIEQRVETMKTKGFGYTPDPCQNFVARPNNHASIYDMLL